MRSPLHIALGVASLALAAAQPALAQSPPSAAEGHRVANANCSRCHAVDRRDESPNPRSPRFRDFGERYPFEGLRQALVEGMIIGHPVLMPKPSLTPKEIDDLIAYLKSLQRPAGEAKRGGLQLLK